MVDFPCLVGCAVQLGASDKKPHTFRMSPRQIIAHSRLSFTLMRWSSPVAAAALPFTFSAGMVGARAFFWAVFVAAVWLASTLWAWRGRSEAGRAVGYMVGFFALLYGQRWAGVHGSDIPFSLFMQWLCLVVLFAGSPLLFFRQQLLHLVRLDESTTAA